MKRIAILTYHKAFNCGAMLQAWALRRFLESKGCAVVFPDCNSVGVSARWDFRSLSQVHGFAKIRQFVWLLIWNACSIGYLDYTRYCYRRFQRRELKGPRVAPRNLSAICDAAVIGSDQVWHPIISKADTPLFFAESIPPELPVVSYAASFGDDKHPEIVMQRLANALARFKAVSVREELAVQELSRFGVRSELVVDPTFLLEAKDYGPLIGPRPIKESYLFVYAVSLSHFVLDSARALAKRKGLKLVICGVYVRSPFRAPPECIWGVSPEKMVSLIAHAEIVLASSFHGTALSLVFSRPFLSLRDSKDTHPTRISTLLDGVCLGERVSDPTKSVDEMLDVLNRPIDWSEVQMRISKQRSESVRFLERALDL